MKKKYLIVIPTYNERKNIKTILKNIKKNCKFMHDILFVDDNSTDGTKEILRNFKNKRLTVINREKKLGVGSAHKVGIGYGYKKKFDFIITMDCDGPSSCATSSIISACSEMASNKSSTPSPVLDDTLTTATSPPHDSATTS